MSAYADEDLDAAVAAGALTPDAAQRFRAFVAARRRTALPDEEAFRLLGGFNDIFVALAILLTLGALGFLLGGPSGGAAALLAAAAWGLAEFFTRRRRMALPSFVLALVFAACCFAAGALLWAQVAALREPRPQLDELPPELAAGLLAAFAGSALHWWRFRVPVTMAALNLAALGAALVVLLTHVPALRDEPMPVLLASGLLLLLLALRWDASDPERITRRSDVALWLHLAAAPLIVHPLFAMLGLLDGGAEPGGAAAAVAIYAALTLVALVLDRRALLVAALAYVIYAVGGLLAQGWDGAAAVAALPAAALGIGVLLLTLSAGWRALRRPVVLLLPASLRRGLPAA